MFVPFPLLLTASCWIGGLCHYSRRGTGWKDKAVWKPGRSGWFGGGWRDTWREWTEIGWRSTRSCHQAYSWGERKRKSWDVKRRNGRWWVEMLMEDFFYKHWKFFSFLLCILMKFSLKSKISLRSYNRLTQNEINIRLADYNWNYWNF